MANQKPKRNDEMEPHEILALGIPRGKARILANTLGISESLVLKWQREPISDENPQATGALNPIERVDRIFDYLLIYNPEVAGILASRYQAKLDAFYSRLSREPMTESEWKSKVAQGLRENSEAIAAIIEEAPSQVIRKEWEEAKHNIEELVRRKETGEPLVS